MSKLDEARQELFRTEQQLARLRGEGSAVMAELTKAKEKLATLGVAENEVQSHLEKLQIEAETLKGKILDLEQELTIEMNAHANAD